ncbi:putative AAA ATPase [Skeletonema marinoi]|uniref:AAA ATPase n=1 Tax=Skeletonema marinoi TaxID=267567 RepID=A0AAD8Y4B3_9STRA|nr:putative AAA ATPase [Skeletonema marinoi]
MSHSDDDDDECSRSRCHAAPTIKEPDQKRARNSHDVSSRKKLMLTRAKGDFDRAEIPFQLPCIIRMQKLGIPASICLMTQNLLECALRGNGNNGDQLHNAYESLAVVGEDLHLLLLDPDRFLFDNQSIENGMQLLYRSDKLYGRDKEETLITDAFCRVSRGKSEAFFIGGFSGSGKSMLVDSLRDRVKCVGGYVTKHKFDAMSREKPLSGVISAFNQVCLMIKGRARPVIAKKLRDEFGVDFSLLLRLLPNVSVLFPELISPAMRVEVGEVMNARSVCFTLLRFVRVVSSPRHPIMLFLDDMQWADSTALDVIHTILSDTMGSSCMFFVGTYRDNEVQIDHDIFDLMERLEISNVRTTKVYLAGLDQEDLNTMISDALCLYPRICKSLSDILFQKTKGNPFFVLEFMQSLKSRGLLQCNIHQKRWVWNEDIIRAEDITDNVLHLLSSKMNGLSGDVQTLLKVMACFGSSTNESVIGYLNESAEYAGVRNGLEGALSDGFIVKDEEGSLQFVHDKVREAAYNLIPDSDKKQFHYHLGKVLYSFCDGEDVGDTIFLIASQINHGKEWILGDKDLSIAIAELNMKAGEKALDGCDHKTAYSYLGAALSLLPNDHWRNHYDLSLRLNFLMAGAAKSCCQYDEAEQILRGISGRTRCFEDKLPSYLLLSQILRTQGNGADAYNTCSFVLLQLGETIPESVAPEAAKTLVEDTLKMYEEVYDDDWLERKMEDKTLLTTLHSTFTGVVTKDDDAVLCYRIAKNAMSLQERFGMATQIPELYFQFYGRVAWRFEPLQVCADNLRRGFETGLSSGNNEMGLQCAFHAIKTAIVSGANLKSTLKEIDYYLHLLKTYKSAEVKNFMLNLRETVSVLIDKEDATGIQEKAVFGDLDDPSNKLRDVLFYHRAIRAYWSGYTERCYYYSEKYMSISWQEVRFMKVQMEFYHGLNSLDILKKKLRGFSSVKCKEALRTSISVMRNAAAHSDWNYANKLCLLVAEQQSLSDDHRNAIKLYDASIKSARKSGFIHEQGLACEKAGFYYKRYGNNDKALEYFKQARECYEEWGSSMKVDFIQNELNNVNVQMLLHNELAR